MTSASHAPRAEVDRCPGVLRPHRAADGALLRLRLPGGELRTQTLDLVSRAAVRYADGDVQLTSRANLQLRGVHTDERGAVHPRLVDDIVRAGLLPYPSHERVRNIVCSPLTGRSGGLADLRPLVRELDDRLCSTPALAQLPGPFLFRLDDGRGDVLTTVADLGIIAVDARTVRLVVGGLPAGPMLPLVEAADAMISLALRFLSFGTAAAGGRRVRHVRGLPQAGRELLVGFRPADDRDRAVGVTGPDLAPSPRFGVFPQDDGLELVSTLAPLGVLGRHQVVALSRAAGEGSGNLIVTPWRGVIVPDLPAASAAGVLRELAAAGLGVTDDTPWRGVTACTGAPRCASGRGDTRSLATWIARARAASATSMAVPVPVHVVGCDRGCGAPSGVHVEVLTIGDHVAVRGVDGVLGSRADPTRSELGTTAAVAAQAAAIGAALDSARASAR